MLFSTVPCPKPPGAKEAAALGFTSSLGPFAVNTYLPGLHQMAESFGVGFVAMEQSLTVYLVSFAVSSIVSGALSDVLGRKSTLTGGMLVFALASFGAMWSSSLTTLCFWRMLQGLGAGVGQVVTQAVVRDVWSGRNAARMNALIAMFFAVSPALAPVLGGWIISLLSWHAVFVFLAVYALSIAVFVQFGMAETHPAHQRTALHLRSLAANYALCLRSAALTAGSAAHGFCFMGGILYTAGSADYVIKIMGLDMASFAWFSLPTVTASLIGSWLSGPLLRHLGARRLVHGVTLVGVVVMATTALVVQFYPAAGRWMILGPCLYWLLISTARPVMMAMNLDYLPAQRGTAAAVQQFLVTFSFAVCAALWVPLVLGHAWKYAAVSALCLILTALSWQTSMRCRPRALQQAGVSEQLL